MSTETTTQRSTTFRSTAQPSTAQPSFARNPKNAVVTPQARAAFRSIKSLIGTYAFASVATLGAAYLMRHDATLVTPSVWIRGGIVAGTSFLLLAIARKASRGGRDAYTRLRIIPTVLLAAVIAVIAVPGAFPLWMKAEQAVCGLLLAGVVAKVNSRPVRSVFGK